MSDPNGVARDQDATGVSPPSETETTPEEEWRDDAVSVQPSPTLRGGHDAAEMGRKGALSRWSEARPKPRSTTEVLEALLSVQLDIAEGRSKGSTAQQKTQAAREARELLEALRIERLRAPRSEVGWDTVPDVQRDACLLILERGSGFAAAVLELPFETTPAGDEYEPGGDAEQSDPPR